MRIATWNVNSIRTRKHNVIEALHAYDIDVLAMQETKCRDDQFPYEDFEAAGYEIVHHGLNQWNGVGFASRLPLTDPEVGFPGMPGFTKNPDEPAAQEARALSVTVEGIRLCSVYVPNGRGLDDPHFSYKLAWLDALASAWNSYRAQQDALPLAVLGDFNIAPLPADVGDPAFLVPGTTHTSPAERTALDAFLASRPAECPGGIHVLGLHRRQVSEEPRAADRLHFWLPRARGASLGGRNSARHQAGRGSQ